MNKKKHIKNNYFIKHLIFLYHVSRGYLFKCGILLGLTIFMDLVQPQIIKEIIDFSIPNKDIKMLITCAFIFLVMSICGNSLNVLLEKDYSTINKKTVIELKNTLINKIENLGDTYWTGSKTGESLKIIEDDVFSVSGFGIDTIFNGLYYIAIIVLESIFLIRINVVVYILVMTISILEIIVQDKMAGIIKNKMGEFRENAGGLCSLIQEYISNIQIAILSKSNKRFWKELLLREEKYRELGISLDVALEKSDSIAGVFNDLTEFSIYFLCGLATIKGEMTIGELLIFIAYINAIFGGLNVLIRYYMSWSQINISLKKIINLMELPEVVKVFSELSCSEDKEYNHILLKNISFSYDKKSVFSDLTMKLDSGINIIVGENGSGKSTLIKLLYGTVVSDAGEIFLGDRSFYEMTLKDIRNQITIVPQVPYLYKDSVINNIINGQEYDENKLSKICFSLGIEKDILNKQIEESGNNVSGGQKQKIAIARGLYEDKNIIIFDEITSSLDVISQKRLLNNIKDLVGDKIIIAITHKTFDQRIANNIFEIKNGIAVRR